MRTARGQIVDILFPWIKRACVFLQLLFSIYAVSLCRCVYLHVERTKKKSFFLSYFGFVASFQHIRLIIWFAFSLCAHARAKQCKVIVTLRFNSILNSQRSSHTWHYYDTKMGWLVLPAAAATALQRDYGLLLLLFSLRCLFVTVREIDVIHFRI